MSGFSIVSQEFGGYFCAMKPNLFVASSVEQLELAYAIQEGLEHDAEVTVWSQGVFQLSKTAMASLLDQLECTHFAVFIFAPDDVTLLRSKQVAAVRDNVLFELGLFIGKLGVEQCFIIAPKNVEDLHLPTDLAGISPVFFDADRQDGNVVAALGPACNRIRKRLGQFIRPNVSSQERPILEVTKKSELISDENDCISIIQSWMGGRPSTDNGRAIRFDVVDRELGLEIGSARKFIKIAAKKWRYVVEREGKDTILFKQDHDNAFYY
jgi:Predicted nucleotide-binding protein containing TIR-like domain